MMYFENTLLAAVGQLEFPKIVLFCYIAQADWHAPRQLVVREVQVFQVGEVAQRGRDRPRQLVAPEVQQFAGW